MFGKGKNKEEEKKREQDNEKSVDEKIHQVNEQAKELIEDKEKLGKLISEAEEKAKDRKDKNGFVKETWESLKTMFELVKLYISGDYRNIPYKSLIFIIGAILYFVMPTDAIPDWIAVVGFTDDAAVIAFTVKKVKEDLDKFLEWKEKQENSDE